MYSETMLYTIAQSTFTSLLKTRWLQEENMPILQQDFVQIPVECYPNIDIYYYHNDYFLFSLHSS